MPILETLGTAASISWNYVIKPGTIIIMSVPKEVEVLEEKRKKLRDLIREADRAAAAAAEEDDKRDRMERARDLRIIDFRIEDVIDEWKSCFQDERVNGTIYIKAIDECMLCEACHHCDPGCVGLLCENAAKSVNTRCYGRLQIAYKIHNIKPDLGEINETSGGDGNESNSSPGQDQSSSIRNPDVEWKNLKRDPYRWETKIEGFEAPSQKMIDWLEDGRAECSVMILVGMAGQGKTTLAKEIFDNKEAIGKFKCFAWINVSDFDDPKDFLRFMLQKFYQEPESPPYGYLTMGLQSLKNEVKKYLLKKRYVLFFDDVWNKKFWQEIEHTVSINGNGSRIIITTRNKEVANTCRESSIVEVEVHEMQPLTDKQSMKLFCRTAFRLDIDNEVCPIRYANLSSEIVKRCEGLPLGIVAIGKHIFAHRNDAFNWKSKIEEAGITEKLCLGYDNLPDHLQLCLLYFGIYPQDYAVKSQRLIRQWIAEGFAIATNYEMGKTSEEVAEDYLASLINRNLVIVSSFTTDGKPRSCRIHYLVRDMVLRKFVDSCFCRCINEDNRCINEDNWSYVSWITRRLSIATNSTEELHGLFDNLLVGRDESSLIRSLHFFTRQELPEDFVSKIPAKCRSLKVLDFENSPLSYVLENLGHLSYLKYLSFRNTKIQRLPRSIGKLRNLETLDVRQTAINQIPEEVSKLRKLRHLLGEEMSLIQLKDGIGGMKSLQTLRDVKIDDGDDGVELVEKELGKLWQIKDLGLTNVGEEHKSAVCSAIKKMTLLEKLRIAAKSVIDLPDLRLPSNLQKLRLKGKLNRLPEWVPRHRLAKLVLSGSKLTDDPLNSLKDIPNLSFLSIIDEAYEGQSLNFQGGFEELEELELGSLSNLSSITVNSEALPSLKKLELRKILLLMTVPPDMQHLKKLEDLNINEMPTDFQHSISQDGVKHQIIKHVPKVRINGKLLND